MYIMHTHKDRRNTSWWRRRESMNTHSSSSAHDAPSRAPTPAGFHMKRKLN